MSLTEADTHAKQVNPVIYDRGWTDDHIKREEMTGAIQVIAGKAWHELRAEPVLAPDGPDSRWSKGDVLLQTWLTN